MLILKGMSIFLPVSRSPAVPGLRRWENRFDGIATGKILFVIGV
jgi:hypothetical protein